MSAGTAGVTFAPQVLLRGGLRALEATKEQACLREDSRQGRPPANNALVVQLDQAAKGPLTPKLPEPL